ncbi:MAG: hypothetical protein MI864_27220 [Pseudomonadales bacterium]|nr:hypothetical protein [Pseudomonadales bacterium]
MFKKTAASTLVSIVVALPATVVFASPTSIQSCPKNYEPVAIDMTALVSSKFFGCPLLQNSDLRKQVDKHAYGTTFAFPAVPGTCLSGKSLDGTLTFSDGSVVYIDGGFTESAQRFFPEAGAMDLTSLFMTGITGAGKPFISGAAMTIMNMQGEKNGEPFTLELVMDDRFTLDLSHAPFFTLDAEEFNILDATGGRSAVGRISATALVYGMPPAPIVNAEFEMQGSFCLK